MVAQCSAAWAGGSGCVGRNLCSITYQLCNLANTFHPLRLSFLIYKMGDIIILITAWERLNTGFGTQQVLSKHEPLLSRASEPRAELTALYRNWAPCSGLAALLKADNFWHLRGLSCDDAGWQELRDCFVIPGPNTGSWGWQKAALVNSSSN